ncbi:MAG: cysteine--tRNA ligase, partial [Acidobacteriota bacterium]
PPAVRKETALQFDAVLGLQLAQWKPQQEAVPDEIMTLVQQRQKARADRRWKEADALREQVVAAGFEIEDTPQGSRVRKKG